MTDHHEDRFDFIPPPPLPGDPMAAHYLSGLARRELRLQRCLDCQLLLHPPRPICRRCESFNLGSSALSGRGLLVDVSAKFETVDPFAEEDLSFRRAVVELIEQDSLQLLTKLVSCDDRPPTIGLPVVADYVLTTSGAPELVFRLVGEGTATGSSTDL